MQSSVSDRRSRFSDFLNLPGSVHFLVFAFVFSVFVNLLMLTGPLFMLQVYDRVLGSRSEETLVALLILVLGLYTLMWALDVSRTLLLTRFGARFQTRHEADAFRTQLLHPHERLSGTTLSRELEAVRAFYASPVVPAIMDACFTPLFAAVIFALHPWLGWTAIAGGLALVAITVANRVFTSGGFTKAQSENEHAHRFAESAVRASDLIKSQGMLDAMTRRFSVSRATALGTTMDAIERSGVFSTLAKTFRLALQSIILALGAWLVLRQEISPGAMIAASILLGRALSPIEQIVSRWGQIAGARSAIGAICDTMSLAPPIEPKTRLPRPTGRLEIKGITVTSPIDTRPVLYNVSFTVDPGEAIGVIGRSGSGKTTIAKCLVGLIEPKLGEVRLDGALVSHYGAAALGAHIGYLPQESMFLPGTIAENVARMALHANSTQVVAAAMKANVHELILSLPQGYETRLDDKRIALSGGQKQRIALARALYGNPALLVLDEPNSALDQEGSEALNAAIRSKKEEGGSVVVMTHRPVAISECDRLLVIENGQVKSFGPRDEVTRSMMKNASEIHRQISGASA